MNEPVSSSQPNRTAPRLPLRFSAAALLSLALMACGQVPTPAPSTARGESGDVSAAMCPVEPYGTTSVRPQFECDPYEPAPDPEPVPDPTPLPPAPPAFEVSPAPGRPDISPEMVQALQEAGLPDPLAVGQTYTGSCNIQVWAARRQRVSQACLITAPANRILRSDEYPGYAAVRWVNQDQKRCTIKEWTVLADGANVKSRTEISDIYGRAIEAALAQGKTSLSIKLGELRSYHLNVIDISSDRATVKVVFEAYGGGFFDTRPGGWCRGKLLADFVGR